MPELLLAETLDGSVLGIDFALSDMLIAVVDGRRLLYAVGRGDAALVTLEIAEDGGLIPLGVLDLDSFPKPGSDAGLVGTPDLLIVTGFFGDSGNGVSLTESGLPDAQVAISGLGAPIAASAAILDETLAFLSAGPGASGVELYLSTGPADFALAGSVADADDLYLAGIVDTAGISFATGTYFVAVSGAENGVTLFEAGSDGSLSVAASLGQAEGLPVSSPADIEVVRAGGATWAIVAASGSSSLSVLRVRAGGELRLRDHIIDSGETRIAWATAVDAVAVGDLIFVAAGGADDGVSLFALLPTGRLVHLDSIEIAGDVASVALSVSGGSLSILVADAGGPGLTRATWDLSTLGDIGVGGGDGDDVLTGGVQGDALSGQAGDDILYDGAGADTLSGAAGTDLFLLAQDGAVDEIVDFDPGLDRLDLSAWDFLSSSSQLTVEPLADGARLTWQDEVLIVRSAHGGPLSATDFDDTSIFNVSRPTRLDLAQEIIGSAGNDTLAGGGGYDTLWGFSGDDSLDGLDLGDEIYGGDGTDTLDGGAGNDSLSGGTGGDLLIGGDGDDVIYGDDFDFV